MPRLVEVSRVLGSVEAAEKDLWKQLVSGLEESQLYCTDDDLGKALLSHANSVTKIHEFFSALDPGICRTRLTRNGVIKSTLSTMRVVQDEASGGSLSDGAMMKEKKSLPHDLFNVYNLNPDESQLYQDTLLCASYPRLCVVDAPMTSPSEAASTPARSPRPRTPRSVRSYSYEISGDEDSLHVQPDTQVLDLADDDEDEEMVAIPPETLCDHLRKCFHLSDEAACHYQTVVHTLNTRRSQSKLLAEELVTQLGWLEANMHPFYNPKKFVSRYAYDQWQQWKRSNVTQLLSRFWSSALPCPKSGNPETEHSKHAHYRLLLNKMFRYDNLHRADGYSTSRVTLMSSASKRLLKEYGLRYGVDDLYRKLLHMELLASHFDVSPQFVRHVCDALVEMTELLPPNRARIVMVKEEYDLFVDVMERLRKLCGDALSKIKRLFPRNDPPSAVESLIDLLKLSVDLTVYLTGMERPSIGNYLSSFSKESFMASYERHKLLVQNDVQLSRMNEEALAPQLLNTLMKNIVDEVQDYRVHYQATFEPYVDITREAANTFYALLMADVRHCCEVIICVPREDHSLNLSLLSIVYSLSQFDQDLAAYIPLQLRSWHASCIPHLLLWLNSIKLAAQRLVIDAIAKDQFTTLQLPTLHLNNKQSSHGNCTTGHRRPSNTVPLRHSRNSPFTLTTSNVTMPAVFSDRGSSSLLYPTSSGYVTGSNNDRIADAASQPSVNGEAAKMASSYSSAFRRTRSDPDFGSMLIFSNGPAMPNSLPSTPERQATVKPSADAKVNGKTSGSPSSGRNSELRNVVGEENVKRTHEGPEHPGQPEVSHPCSDYDVISFSSSDEINLGISASFLDVYLLIQRYVNLAKRLLDAAIPLPEFGERDQQSNLMPDLSRYVKETLSDRKRVYLKVLKGLCNVVFLYCDNLAALDLCALPKNKAKTILSGETLRHLDGLYSSNLIWGCRHTKTGVACDKYHNRHRCVVADKYEPVTQEMCSRINALVAMIDALPSLRKMTRTALQGERLAEMIAQKLSLDNSGSSKESEFEWISSYAVEDDHPGNEAGPGGQLDDVSSGDPFDLHGRLDEPFQKCGDHAESLLDSLLEVMSYRLNLFIRTTLSVLLEVRLPHAGIEQRFKPLADFLRMSLEQLSTWLYPSAYRSLLSKLWVEIVKDFEQEIGLLLERKWSEKRGAGMYIHAVTYLVRVVNNRGRGLPVEELMKKMERVVMVLKLFLEPAERLIALYYHLDRQSNDSDLGSLIEEPLSKEYLQQMKTDLHRFRKCFSAKDLVSWIMNHTESFVVSDSNKSLSLTDEELALDICHRLVEDHVICDVDAIQDMEEEESSDSPVTYPKIAICTDFAGENPPSRRTDRTVAPPSDSNKNQEDQVDPTASVIYTSMQPAKPLTRRHVTRSRSHETITNTRKDVIMPGDDGENSSGTCQNGSLPSATMDRTSGGKIVVVVESENEASKTLVASANHDADNNIPVSPNSSPYDHPEQHIIIKRRDTVEHTTQNISVITMNDSCDKSSSSPRTRSTSFPVNYKKSPPDSAARKATRPRSKTLSNRSQSIDPIVITYDDNFSSQEDLSSSRGPIARSSAIDTSNFERFTNRESSPVSDDSALADSAPVTKVADWTCSSSDEELTRVESDYVLALKPEFMSTVSLAYPGIATGKGRTPPPFFPSETQFYCFTSTIEARTTRRQKTPQSSVKSLLEKLQRPSSLHQVRMTLEQCTDLHIPATMVLAVMSHLKNKEDLLKSYFKRLPKEVLKQSLGKAVGETFGV